MKEELFKSINCAKALSEQIQALLDLMMMANSSVDIQSINTAAEMCLTMHDELMVEVQKIFEVAKKETDLKATIQNIHDCVYQEGFEAGLKERKE